MNNNYKEAYEQLLEVLQSSDSFLEYPYRTTFGKGEAKAFLIHKTQVLIILLRYGHMFSEDIIIGYDMWFEKDGLVIRDLEKALSECPEESIMDLFYHLELITTLLHP